MEDLSESILQHIFSFLNFTDVIRASAVSRAWLNAVSTLQCLNITDDFIRPLNSVNRFDQSARERKMLPKEMVRSMLVSAGCFILKAKEHNLQINQFRFKFRGKLSYFVPYLMQCVNLIGTENVREFVLDVGIGGGRLSDYSLPVSVYAAHSLHKLVVRGLKLSLVGIRGINLPSLRELDLSCCQVDDEFFEQLIMKCPQLENFKIEDCFGFRVFKVLGSHPKLKKIDLMKDEEQDYLYCHAPEEIQEIEIREAPNLEYFRYWSNDDDLLEILDIGACVNLKVLDLTALCGSHKLLESVEHLVSHLSVLEEFTLHLFTWIHSSTELQSIKISSDSLRKLWLGFVNNPVDVRVDAPYLSEVFYLGFISSNLSFGTSSIKDANFVKCGEDKISSFYELVEFLKTFNHIEAVKLDDFAPRDLAVPTDLDFFDPPLWDIKHLTVGARYCCGNSYIPVDLDMLKSLLWMAPRLDTLSFVNGFKSAVTFQFIHGNPEINVEEVPFICRNNKVVKVKVESCPGSAEGLGWKKYLFNGEKSLGCRIKQLKVQVMSKLSGE
ncbi:OLC1v1013895C1 [Oldenlandia corymbosa var. corymbosa]|uniref:OLC1v1013895C1 n=1 Tax=Oldenlandia corymbosa var. corymbosa TaxID=529605 RepID=A0AAV1DZH0_OLDCO|nr:OLC1v1013895C1 [Oldenlandia corymbosa var. corymbosa]